MVYNPERERIEIAQKIFWDDLEAALSKKNKGTIDFLNPDQPEKLEALIASYLLEMNKITINGKPLPLNYLGHEVEGDAAWFYLESEMVQPPKKILITNEVLIEEYSTQQNIVNFYLDKKPKSLITQREKTSGMLEFP